MGVPLLGTCTIVVCLLVTYTNFSDAQMIDESKLKFENQRLSWSEARQFCRNHEGEMSNLTARMSRKVAKDAVDLIDGNEEIHIWTNNETTPVYKVQQASTNPVGFFVSGDKAAKLAFYCTYEDGPSTPNTTPLVPNTTPSVPITTSTTPNTTPYYQSTTGSTSNSTTSSSTNVTDETIKTVPPTTFKPLCCPTTVQRGITWNYTCGDAKVSRKCPQPTQNGDAVWNCNGATGNWYPKNPDLSACKSSPVDDLLKMIDLSDVPGAYSYLSRAAAQSYAGGDIIAVADVLDNVTSTLANKQNLTAEAWFDVIENVTDAVADTLNSFLNSPEMWTDIPEEKRVDVADRILGNLNKVGFQLTYALNETQYTVDKENVFLQAIKEPKGSFVNRNLTLPLTESSSSDIIMTLNSGFEDDVPMTDDDSGYTTALFTILHNMEEVLLLGDRSLLRNSTNITKINSPVVSLKLLESNIFISLKNNMSFIMPRNKGLKADSPICAFWNVTRKTWSDEGCRVIPSNDTPTTCVCDHLTNFALLMDIHGVVNEFSEVDLEVLTIITYIGCIISIVSLTICVILTTAIRQLWCVRNTIHRNLSLCLLVGEVLLISGLERTEYKTLCSVIAGLLHYSFLAAFFWMSLEAVFIYILLEKVFAQRRSFIERYYIFGYGMPLLVISISAGVNPSGYGTPTHCWLSSEKAMMWSFAAPVLVIVVVNIVALIFALRTAIVMSKKRADNHAAAKQWIYGSLTLVPLLGVTWGIGFLTWNGSGFGVVNAYVFTIFNSLQGLCIFLVQVVLNKKVRRLVRGKLSGSFRRTAPLSKSATTNPKTTSSTNGSNSHHPVILTSSGHSKVAGDSVHSKSKFCPESPVAFFNQVMRNGRSYNVSTGQSTRSTVSEENSAMILRVREAKTAEDSEI